MKKRVILSLILAMLMLFSVSACSTVEEVKFSGFEVKSEITVTQGSAIVIEKPLVMTESGDPLDVLSDVTTTSGGIVTVNSGSFLATDLDGYVITYVVYTADGRTHKKTTTVTEKDLVSELYVDYDPYEVVGEEVEIVPICDVDNAQIGIEVLHEGEKVQLTDGKFTPAEAGKYEITVTATALGKSIEYQYTIYARYPAKRGEVETYHDDWAEINAYQGKNRGKWTVISTEERGI